LSAQANKLGLINKLLNEGLIDEENLEFKLKKDMVKALGSLEDSKKTLYMDKDLTDFNGLFENLKK